MSAMTARLQATVDVATTDEALTFHWRPAIRFIKFLLLIAWLSVEVRHFFVPMLVHVIVLVQLDDDAKDQRDQRST